MLLFLHHKIYLHNHKNQITKSFFNRDTAIINSFCLFSLNEGQNSIFEDIRHFSLPKGRLSGVHIIQSTS